VILLRPLLKLIPPFQFSSDDVDEIAATSLLWLPCAVFVFSRLWLARRSLQAIQKSAMDIFFATHLVLWFLAKVQSRHRISNIGHFQLLHSFLIQLAQCAFL
jgi:hypothetical protein